MKKSLIVLTIAVFCTTQLYSLDFTKFNWLETYIKGAPVYGEDPSRVPRVEVMNKSNEDIWIAVAFDTKAFSLNDMLESKTIPVPKPEQSFLTSVVNFVNNRNRLRNIVGVKGVGPKAGWIVLYVWTQNPAKEIPPTQKYIFDLLHDKETTVYLTWDGKFLRPQTGQFGQQKDGRVEAPKFTVKTAQGKTVTSKISASGRLLYKNVTDVERARNLGDKQYYAWMNEAFKEAQRTGKASQKVQKWLGLEKIDDKFEYILNYPR